MNRIVHLSLLSMLCMALMGCGFHLRGTTTAAQPHHQRLNVEPDEPFDQGKQAFKEWLGFHHIEIQADKTAPTLFILKELSDSHILAYGSDGQTRRVRLQYSITFKVEAPDHTLLIPPTTLSTYRDQSLNADQELGDLNEAARLERDMHHELADRLAEVLIFS